MKSVAVTYAHSLFSLAKDEGLSEQIFAELKEIFLVFKENSEYAALLDSPTVKLEERLSLIDEAFAGCNEYVKNFLKILCEKKYVHLFPECVKEFEKQYNKDSGIEKITAITAVPLGKELRDKLIKKLEKEYGKKINLDCKIDASILGGIILRTENSQTDASVRARLDGIRTMLSSDQTD